MINFKNVKVIDLGEWDDLVEKTYGKPYSFQQQNGCQSRGTHYFKVPDYADDFENDTIPEKINGDEMGVSFKAWLARDPDEWNSDEYYFKDLFWGRNFYPEFQTVANDLHEKGLIPAGEYQIDIDW